ncbi:MAG: hypothetical protein QOE65_364 [Solirubrobacteraceae bacterium]|jgi:hypothetical protein|nr:hypothetical protein [Solirubrobacteraceae bacterium]
MPAATVGAMTFELERLAYETAQRALDKQERLLDDLRSRAGVLVAVSSLATSFLGQSAFRRPPLALAGLALGAFVITLAGSLYVLAPRDSLVFSQSGPVVYETLFGYRDEPSEIYVRLAYELDDYRSANHVEVRQVGRVYRWTAAALLVQILAMTALVTGTIA